MRFQGSNVRAIEVLTVSAALPIIEYVFDIGSAAAASPSGVCGRIPETAA
jgi:hypothetical protein